MMGGTQLTLAWIFLLVPGSLSLYFAQKHYTFYFSRKDAVPMEIGKLFPLMNKNTQEQCTDYQYSIKNNVRGVIIADTGWITIENPTVLQQDRTDLIVEVACWFYSRRMHSIDIEVTLAEVPTYPATDIFLCFGDNSLDFTIEENFRMGRVGSVVVLPSALTRNLSLEYVLTGNLCSQRIAISGNASAVSFIRPFDREVMNKINCVVDCQITRPNSETRTISKNMTINVTDMNDNPPLFHKKKGQEHERDGKISFDEIKEVLEDADLETLSTYAVRTINDYLLLCNATIHQVMQFPNSSKPGIMTSAVLLGVRIGDLEKLKKIHSPEYVCKMEIENIGYLGPPDKSSKAVLLVHLKKRKPTSDGLLGIETIPLNINAKRYHQIKHYPGDKYAPYNIDVTSGNTFAITESGTLYLNIDVFWKTAQRSYSISVLGQNFTSRINVSVHGVSRKINVCSSSCSFHNKKRLCERECGLGSPDGKCVWRKDTTGKTSLTTMYDTCTPTVSTCPDSKCDEVEQLNKLICPQDCTKGSSNGEMKMNPNGGISLAKGPCWCDRYANCQCWHDEEPDYDLYTTTKSTSKQQPSAAAKEYSVTGVRVIPNETVANVIDPNGAGTGAVQTYSELQRNENVHCGTVCKVVVVFCVVVICIAALMVLILWKRRRCSHSSSLKHVTSVGSMSAVPSEYIDDREILSSPKTSKQMVSHKWLFPRGNLILSETLGEGEFGMVVKAAATDIDNNPGSTIVAVKMLKNYSSDAEKQDLLSEFTLLQEVNHPNVIKLLGACLNDGGPLYVIVEYCENGSLRTYLRKCRVIDTSLVGALWDQEKFEHGNEDSGMSIVTMRGLMSFAWQIAKGMRYLSEMKLVHRDLAARNILVSKNRLLKISDFGLSRDVYEADTYLKKSKGRIPVKWMAPESLFSHIYTSQSDVWSYGIMLWEIVTLGANPYPGILPERLFNLLKTGYRMDRPEECPDELYAVMQKCWKSEPSLRPSFGSLADIFERMLRQKTGYLEVSSTIPSPEKQFQKSAHKHLSKEAVEDYPETQSDVEISYLLPKDKGSITSESYDSDEQLHLLRCTEPNRTAFKNRNTVAKTIL